MGGDYEKKMGLVLKLLPWERKMATEATSYDQTFCCDKMLE